MLSGDTRALLLLRTRFSTAGDGEARELSPADCRRLVDWLAGRDLTPSALLDAGCELHEAPVEEHRLRALLQRGSQLEAAMTDWCRRGIWVAGATDAAYPPGLRALGPAPPLVYGAGSAELIIAKRPALAVVGSREAGQAAIRLARAIGTECARLRVPVVSGSARGIDSEAMRASLDSGGEAIGVLSDSLAAAAANRRYKEALAAGRLALFSAHAPYTPFSVGNAMGRNKYIYAMAQAALVIWSAAGAGGTWAGATEALKRGKTPVYVWCDDGVPEGNRQLVTLGATPVSESSWRKVLATLTISTA